MRPREGSSVEADYVVGLYLHTENSKNKQATQLRLHFRLSGSNAFCAPIVVPDPGEKVHLPEGEEEPAHNQPPGVLAVRRALVEVHILI